MENKNEKIRVKRRYQLEDALQELGNIVYIGDKQYKFLPFWFEFDGDSIFVHSLGDLPKELVDFISDERGNVMPMNVAGLRKSPATLDECGPGEGN